ncbi:MAG: PilZ domain-containing protein [Planctomycetota bacterium]|nr:PilZ domain-containing protein [Planctomycetota bacterium]
MGEYQALEPTLDALVSGKRASPRRPVHLDAVVKAARGEFRGVLLDLSKDGALLSIPITELNLGTEGPLGPAEQFGVLEGHFRDSFDIHVPSCGVVAESQVVRLLVSMEHSEDLAMGCRFVQTLSPAQQAKLGLLDATDALTPWNEAILQHDLRWAADPARTRERTLLRRRRSRPRAAVAGLCDRARRAGRARTTVRGGP